MMDFFTFLEESPTAHHVTSTVTQILKEAGFREFKSGGVNGEAAEGYYLRRGTGFLAALRPGSAPLAEAGARITLAHTDSPALQLKVRGVSEKGSLRTAPIEVYGSPIISTWLDRPLEIAGTIAISGAEGPELHPVRTGRAVGVIPNLAIHLNRKVNEGFSYEKQTHLRPLLEEGLLEPTIQEGLCRRAGLPVEHLLDWELYLILWQKPEPWGFGESGYYSASRIDNLAGVYANLQALLAASSGEATQVAIFFDHEEVGSLSRTGARSPFVLQLLQELLAGELGRSGPRRVGATVRGSGSDVSEREAALWNVIERSLLLSNDATHGNHPNYPEKLDPAYLPELGKGPAIKLSAVRRYATEPEAVAVLRLVAEEAGVPLQEIQNRADVPAGTTVGPMSAGGSLIPTVDLGVPILAMHSAVETGHLGDIGQMSRLITTFYGSHQPSRSSKIF